MGIAERKIRQKEEVRASILKAAWQVVEEEGWQALSVRKIADAIEYSVPVIYDHFENKEAILLEFTRMGFRQLNEDLLKVRERQEEPEQQIRVMAYAYWDFALHNREYYQLMYGLGMPSCETVRQIPELQAFTGIFQEPIKALLDKGGKDSSGSFLKLNTLWSFLHGLISINRVNDVEDKRKGLNDMILKDFIGSFIAGLKE